ncbi:universal stress protein [Dactylosporangium sp. NPDC000244]|uniref:universal stress protein n=1 Tax=Dactylosporangium sp. NPDC000244 TaxID=3154365 RepID=UPI00332A4D34
MRRELPAVAPVNPPGGPDESVAAARFGVRTVGVEEVVMVAEQSVVVGVDGSAPSLHAVDWAAVDAVRRRRPLHILYAIAWPPAYPPAAAPVPSPYEVREREKAAQTVATAATRARAAAPDVRISTSMQADPPTVALLRASGHACEVVVGNRGHGGFAGLLLGSVGVQVAAHAPCPVVVVRDADRPAGSEAGRVVVGIDGSHDAGDALGYAFEHASASASGLTAVLAYRWPGSVTRPDDLLPLTYDADDLAAEEERTLAESVAGWREKFPDVDLRTSAVRGRAAGVLVERSAGARLLVVGSRGRGGFAGLLLGSVSQVAIHHAACPVAVIRHAARESS